MKPVTRRNITLSKISNNILLHNAPTDFQNFNDIQINSTNVSGPFIKGSRGAHIGVFSSNVSNSSHMTRAMSGYGHNRTLLGKQSMGLQINSNELLNSTSLTGEAISSSLNNKSRTIFKRSQPFLSGT